MNPPGRREFVRLATERLRVAELAGIATENPSGVGLIVVGWGPRSVRVRFKGCGLNAGSGARDVFWPFGPVMKARRMDTFSIGRSFGPHRPTLSVGVFAMAST